MKALAADELHMVSGGDAVQAYLNTCAKLRTALGPTAASQIVVRASGDSMGNVSLSLGAGASRVVRRLVDVKGDLTVSGGGGADVVVEGPCIGPDQTADDEEKAEARQ